MFKLVVLSVVLAVVAAAPTPGFLHAAPVAVAAPLAIPAAVSHTSRIDIHSKPIIATYAAPLVAHHAVVAAPIVKSYGLLDGYGYGYGYGLHGLHGGLHGW